MIQEVDFESEEPSHAGEVQEVLDLAPGTAAPPSTMAARYQHLTAEIRRDIANRVGGLIWETSGGADGDVPTRA